VTRLTALVQRYRSSPHVELEVRLGTRSATGTFVPGVDFEYSTALYKAMTDEESVRQWSVKPDVANFRHMYFDGGLRGTYLPNGASHFVRIVREEDPVDAQCAIRPYGLRFGLKGENPAAPYQGVVPPSLVRVVTRVSFADGPWRYDFSKVGAGTTTEDACKVHSIHIELELTRDNAFLSNTSDRMIAINMLGKARDLLGRFDPGTREPNTLPLTMVHHDTNPS